MLIRRISGVFLVVSLLAGCKLEHVSFAARKEYIRKAKVWHKTDVAKMNIFAGPQNELAFRPEQEVSCRYQEPKEKIRGFSPKFKCKLSSGQIVRVKYKSRETHAEIAGTRLLWALGFYTDEVYPVKLKCIGCPSKNPAKPSKDEPRIELMIEGAIIERNFPGREIGVYRDQGWKWEELDDVDPGVGGSTKAEVDALKLLAVFIQHTDSKPAQQRLGCNLEDIEKKRLREICKHPVMMVQDLGATFGTGAPKVEEFSSMYLRGWKSQPVWNQIKEEAFLKKNGQRVCVGNLIPAIAGELVDPQISEDGRLFLSNLLNQLTDRQIADLFRVARAEKTDEMIIENDNERPVTVDDWVAVFKMKRQEINDHRCS